MPLPKRPATVADWRKAQLADFKADLKSLDWRIKVLTDQREDLVAIYSALKKTQLRSKAVRATNGEKRKMSPEGLKRLRAANKKMWARKRKEKKANGG